MTKPRNHKRSRKNVKKSSKRNNKLRTRKQRGGSTLSLIDLASMGKINAVKSILTRPDTDVNMGDNNGFTALQLASMHNRILVVNVLLAQPTILVNKEDKAEERTALLDAAEEGHTEVVKALLAHPDIDVNKGDIKGETALYLAASYGHIEVVNTLLAHPAIEINKANTNGITALQKAKSRGLEDVVIAIQNAIQANSVG